MKDNSRLNLVSVDDSDNSWNAFIWFIDNHHRENDTIGIVHVHQMPPMPTMGIMIGETLNEDYHKEVKESIAISKGVQKKYEDYCQEKNFKYEFYMTEFYHKIGRVICDVAKENNASSIILGQRGLGTISRMLVGSTSDYVLHHADIPVIIVPSRKVKETHDAQTQS